MRASSTIHRLRATLWLRSATAARASSPERAISIGLSRAQHDDPRVLRRRVRADIGEVEVERDEGPPLYPAALDQSLIWRAAERLVEHALAVVPGLA